MRIADALARVEQAAWRVARETLSDRARPRELRNAILALSALYNERDGEAAVRAATGGLRDERLLAARLLFFTLADLPKAALALAELATFAPLVEPGAATLPVLDLGAGCGAMGLGLACLLDALSIPTRIELAALDSDERALGLARRVAEESGLALTLEPRRHELAQPLPDDGRRYRLILAGSVLNELAPERRLPLALELLGRLAPGGALVAIEPATRAHSRGLLALRDRVLESSDASLLAPCTRRGPCPALASGDWCHECRIWTPPPELRALASASGLRRRDLVYSYLTLAAAPPSRPLRAGAWRVVSAPLRSKGKHELFLCGEPGRHRVTLLNRHRSESNAGFLEAERGQLLWLEGELESSSADAIRIGAGTRVERVDPAASIL